MNEFFFQFIVISGFSLVFHCLGRIDEDIKARFDKLEKQLQDMKESNKDIQ